jgi:hypothetical protein
MYMETRSYHNYKPHTHIRTSNLLCRGPESGLNYIFTGRFGITAVTSKHSFYIHRQTATDIPFTTRGLM